MAMVGRSLGARGDDSSLWTSGFLEGRCEQRVLSRRLRFRRSSDEGVRHFGPKEESKNKESLAAVALIAKGVSVSVAAVR
ncbi:hypothetical protein U1Q18_015973 [Sarracenia purpurea var. burkii]